ncbi:MAG TPA: porin family protein [Paludibacteraceae bacterium]|nr:porin family protein [Paludibacteraceae bacterium]HPH62845.1 porin family protein [Paludibacteraceae bacterium]
MKKIILSIIMLLTLTTTVNAQYSGLGRVQNLIYVDNKRYHFGFILGLNTMDFNVTNYGSTVVDSEGKVWFADQPDYSAGFTVGIISDLRIFEYLNLRFTPALLFGDRTLKYTDNEGNIAEQTATVKSSLINFPLLLKFRGQRSGNYRPYLLGGASATWDLARKTEDPVLLKKLDFGIEFGIGCDLYMPYFKLAPELKMFIGLNDILDRDRPEIVNEKDLKYTNVISKLTSRIFMLSFNFE